MRYELQGSIMPALEIYLDKGEEIYTQTGSMSWMNNRVDMKTSGQGGIGGFVNRIIAGEGAFVTKFEGDEDNALVAFTPKGPGKIIAVPLADGQSIIAQKDSFLCAESSVKFEVSLTKRLGAAFFGGEGFILQKFSGPGVAFMELSGEIVERTLADGEELRVDPGYIGMFENTVEYDIRRQRGVRNLLFGGEEFFFANLKGPGKVWLQTMPIHNLALTLYEIMPKGDLAKLQSSEDEGDKKD